MRFPPVRLKTRPRDKLLACNKVYFFPMGRHSRLWVCLTTAGASRHRGLFRTQQQELALVALAGWGLLATEVSGGSIAVDAASAMAAIIAAKEQTKDGIRF